MEERKKELEKILILEKHREDANKLVSGLLGVCNFLIKKMIEHEIIESTDSITVSQSLDDYAKSYKKSYEEYKKYED
jgi:hypothetical protein